MRRSGTRRSGEHGNGYRNPRHDQEDAEDGEQPHLPRTATSHTKPRIKHLESLAWPVPPAGRSLTELALTAGS